LTELAAELRERELALEDGVRSLDRYVSWVEHIDSSSEIALEEVVAVTLALTAMIEKASIELGDVLGWVEGVLEHDPLTLHAWGLGAEDGLVAALARRREVIDNGGWVERS
jgi:hypothetical protein